MRSYHWCIIVSVATACATVAIYSRCVAAPLSTGIIAELEANEAAYYSAHDVAVAYKVGQQALLAVVEAKSRESATLERELAKSRGIKSKPTLIVSGHTDPVAVAEPCAVAAGDVLSQEVDIVGQSTAAGTLTLVGVVRLVRTREGKALTLIDQPLRLYAAVERPATAARKWRAGIIGGANTHGELGYGAAATYQRDWATLIVGGLYNYGYIQLFVGVIL